MPIADTAPVQVRWSVGTAVGGHGTAHSRMHVAWILQKLLLPQRLRMGSRLRQGAAFFCPPAASSAAMLKICFT
eukprot:gene9672-biopygen992